MNKNYNTKFEVFLVRLKINFPAAWRAVGVPQGTVCAPAVAAAAAAAVGAVVQE